MPRTFITATVYGRRALFCGPACRDGFRCDREHGLIYGPFPYTDGTFAMNAEEYSRETRSCAYCRADEPERRSRGSSSPDDGNAPVAPGLR